MIYSDESGSYPLPTYFTRPANAISCDCLKQPLLSSEDANPTFISRDLVCYPTVSYEISYPSGTTGTLTVLGNNSGDPLTGEQLSTAALSGTKALAKFASYGYRYLILKITTLSGSISDVLIVGKR